MTRATRLVALELALTEAKARVREVGGWNAGPRVEMYQRADTLPGVRYAWCQSFQNAMWRLATGGFISPAKSIIGGEHLAGGTASVGIAASWARQKGYVVGRPLKGDHFAMNLTSDNWPDHVGQVVKVLSMGPLGYLCRTVEGNTGSGSVDEGDGVYVRTRFLRKSRTVFYRVPGATRLPAIDESKLLRRRTGFASWWAWYRGAGAWENYGRRNKKVRPDVPRRIPLSWWRLAKARKK